MWNKGKPASLLRRNEATPALLVGLLQLSELSCRLIRDFLMGERGSDVEESTMSPTMLLMGSRNKIESIRFGIARAEKVIVRGREERKGRVLKESI